MKLPDDVMQEIEREMQQYLVNQGLPVSLKLSAMAEFGFKLATERAQKLVEALKWACNKCVYPHKCTVCETLAQWKGEGK